jgi:hypothetical protein
MTLWTCDDRRERSAFEEAGMAGTHMGDATMEKSVTTTALCRAYVVDLFPIAGTDMYISLRAVLTMLRYSSVLCFDADRR